jgi:hypothetical protein
MKVKAPAISAHGDRSDYLKQGREKMFRALPPEVQKKRDGAAHKDGGGKNLPNGGNADEKNRDGADGEKQAAHIAVGRYLRHVDFCAGAIDFHDCTS